MYGESARRNDAPCDGVDKYEFIAGRVKITKETEGDIFRQERMQDVYHIRIFFLDTNNPPDGAGHFHDGAEPCKHLIREGAQEFLILVEERFALGGIHDDDFRSGAAFYLSGKTGAAPPHNSPCAQLFRSELKGHVFESFR
jgi:hypothetical protein